MLKVKTNEVNENRINTALRLGQPDAVPIDLVNLCNFLSGWLNFKPIDYFTRPDFMLNAQVKFRERFNGMGIIGPDYGVAVEASAFGAGTYWPEDNPPWALHMIDDIEELPAFAKALKIPHPLMDGYLPLVVSTYFYMRERVGDIVAPPRSSLGPWDLACLLLGTTNIMLATKLYPEALHQVLRKTTQFVEDLMVARAELFGLDMDMIYMGEDQPGQLSLEAFREFVVPYTGKIYKSLANSDSICMWHSDGKLGHLIEALPELGINALTSFDPWTDLREFKSKIGDKICLLGNLDPIRVLRNGTDEEVTAEIRRLLEIGKHGGGFVIATGGELPHGVTAERLDLFLKTVEKFGYY